MPDTSLGRARLVAQGLITQPFDSPSAAVAASGAMQGQDLPGAIASVALRVRGATAVTVTEAFDEGEVVRGYPMRGTVFLVAAPDLAWMTALCAAPATRAAENRRSQLGLDADLVDRAREVAVQALADEDRGLARADLFAAWQASGQPTDAGRGYHLLAYLIGTGVLCYGPWNRTDQNVVLASRWLPEGSDLEGRFNGDRIAAVAELLRRYLLSHGPATLRDFAWWTKLPLREVRAAFALIAGDVEQVSGTDFHQRPGLTDEVAALGRRTAGALLLPGFDEFVLGYQDRLFAMTEHEHTRLVPGNNGVFAKSVVIGGSVRGLWKLGGRPGKRSLVLDEFEPGLSDRQRTAVQKLFDAWPTHALG